MKIYDISMNIDENMKVYKNKIQKKPKLINKSNFENSQAYETDIKINLHTGTHIDAPLHMIEDGATIDKYNLDKFITKCRVLDLTNIENTIDKKNLIDKNIKENEFLLFKTKNSFDKEFNFNFIYLNESGAKFLKEKSVKGVGIDSLGIERNQNNHPTHKILLSNNIPIIEGLKLKDIDKGEYILIALPIKINNVEASLTRAVLINKKDLVF
ncbi:MAG: cyclase family protein [Bacillota bacterium]